MQKAKVSPGEIIITIKLHPYAVIAALDSIPSELLDRGPNCKIVNEQLALCIAVGAYCENVIKHYKATKTLEHKSLSLILATKV